MESRIKVSSSYHQASRCHDIRLLISLSGAAPVNRPPINVALVLDRSGSMGGRPIRAAKDAAKHFASALGPADRVSIVAFDTTAELLAGPLPGGDPEILRAIDGLVVRSATDLSAGWRLGEQNVRSVMVPGTNRVVLFTDGQANRGTVNLPTLVQMAKTYAESGISTSCIGFSAHFNEDLLESIARAGRGNYWYIEEAGQMLDIFSSEIENLLAYAAENVVLDVTPTRVAETELQLLSDLPFTVSDEGVMSVLAGNFYANTPTHVGIQLRIVADPSDALREIARVRVSADEVIAGGTQRRVIEIPVRAVLDGTGHLDASVEITLLRLRLARCRDAAVESADRGDFGAAVAALREGVLSCVRYANDVEIADEISGLKAQVNRLLNRQYSSADRKYQKAHAMATRQGKGEYLEMLRKERGE